MSPARLPEEVLPARSFTHELSPHIRTDYIGTQLVSLEILGASAILPAAALEQSVPRA